MKAAGHQAFRGSFTRAPLFNQSKVPELRAIVGGVALENIAEMVAKLSAERLPRSAAFPEEVELFNALPAEQNAGLGAIGHIRIDFGGGNKFSHTWWPRGDKALNSPEFKTVAFAPNSFLANCFVLSRNLFDPFCAIKIQTQN